MESFRGGRSGGFSRTESDFCPRILIETFYGGEIRKRRSHPLILSVKWANQSQRQRTEGHGNGKSDDARLFLGKRSDFEVTFDQRVVSAIGGN